MKAAILVTIGIISGALFAVYAIFVPDVMRP